MLFVKIAGYMWRNPVFHLVHQIRVTPAHLCGHFESDVQKLAKTAVICGTLGIVPERGRKLISGPAAHFIGRG